MPSCAVTHCKNNSGSTTKTNSGITFHRFPKKLNLRQDWIKALRECRQDETWMPSVFSVVCSKHFAPKDFYITQNGLRYLNKNSIPSRNLRRKSSSHLNAKLKKQIEKLKLQPQEEEEDKKEEEVKKEEEEKEEVEEEKVKISGSEYGASIINSSLMFQGEAELNDIVPILRNMSFHLQTMATKQEDSFESFGTYVAAILRQMSERNAIELRPQILHLLMASTI